MQKLSFEQVSAFFEWKCKNPPPGLKKSKKAPKMVILGAPYIQD